MRARRARCGPTSPWSPCLHSRRPRLRLQRSSSCRPRSPPWPSACQLAAGSLFPAPTVRPSSQARRPYVQSPCPGFLALPERAVYSRGPNIKTMRRRSAPSWGSDTRSSRSWGLAGSAPSTRHARPPPARPWPSRCCTWPGRSRRRPREAPRPLPARDAALRAGPPPQHRPAHRLGPGGRRDRLHRLRVRPRARTWPRCSRRRVRCGRCEAAHLMLQLLDALACAHTAGVVHRDLKPANIMVVPTGVAAQRAGRRLRHRRARRRAGATSRPVTLTHESIGTPAYAAPEQLRGQPPRRARTSTPGGSSSWSA